MSPMEAIAESIGCLLVTKNTPEVLPTSYCIRWYITYSHMIEPTERVSSFLDNLIKPLVPTMPSYIKDSPHLSPY